LRITFRNMNWRNFMNDLGLQISDFRQKA